MKSRPIHLRLCNLEKSSSYAVTCTLLFVPLLMILYPFTFTPNEEVYFQLAHRKVQPEEYGTYHAVFDSSNVRILFDYTLGTLISVLGFDTAHFVTRIGAAVLYALSIGYFFNSLKLPAISGIAILGIFLLNGQFIVGEEWLFNGVESKVPSYCAVFFAFGLAINGKRGGCTALLILATYCHFLVGGFWAAAIFAYIMLEDGTHKRTLRIISTYIIFVTPLLFVILYEQYSNALPPLYQGVSSNLIYQLRSPHHIAPYTSLNSFVTNWWPGIVFASAVLFFLIRIKSLQYKTKLFPLLTLLLVYLFFALIVSYLDRNTNYVGNFYLFRPSALILFLFITVCIHCLLNTNSAATTYVVTIGLTSIALFTLIKPALGFTKELVNPEPSELPGQSELINAVQALTHKEDVVIIEPRMEMRPMYASLPRVIGRQSLVSWKFNPTLPNELLDWFSKYNFKAQLFKYGCTGELKYKVDYLLVLFESTLDNVNNCGEIVWAASGRNVGTLIKINEQWRYMK